MQKNKLDDLSNKFLELKTLAIKYKKNKDEEINDLNLKIDSFKKTIEDSSSLYETMLDKTTKSLEKIINDTELNSKVQ